MLHRFVAEAIDRTLQDLLNCDRPFGGKLTIFTGDFKQCLPVIPGADRSAVVNATLRNSYLWNSMERYYLTSSMRHGPNETEWVNYLEELGNGRLNNALGKTELKHVNVVYKIYPDLYETPLDRAILAPTNKVIDGINNFIVDEAPGRSYLYRSIDTSIIDEGAIQYPTEFLNSLESGSLPPHKLRLKIGTPIIIIRNIKQPEMVNGTKCVVTKLHPNVIEGKNTVSGQHLLIPRITLCPSDNSNDVLFKRKQFPVKVAYAMTITRAEGKTFAATGIDLQEPCFGHGQLYTGLSRTPSPANIHVLMNEGSDMYTPNPVYEEALCLRNMNIL